VRAAERRRIALSQRGLAPPAERLVPAALPFQERHAQTRGHHADDGAEHDARILRHRERRHRGEQRGDTDTDHASRRVVLGRARADGQRACREHPERRRP
jgi:hypothetical protein